MTFDNLRKFEKFVDSRKRMPEKFRKTKNTSDHYPIFYPLHVFDKPIDEWSHSELVRLITFQITGMYTIHAPENLVILGEYLNMFVVGNKLKLIVRSELSNGMAYFYHETGEVFKYNFQPRKYPSEKDFLREFDEHMLL